MKIQNKKAIKEHGSLQGHKHNHKIIAIKEHGSLQDHKHNHKIIAMKEHGSY